MQSQASQDDLLKDKREDTQEISLLAHQLKGMGGSFGFPRITQHARILEIEAKTGEYDNLPNLAQQLCQLLQESVEQAASDRSWRGYAFMTSDIKILIADDISAMRAILKKVLREYGYEQVEESSNGEDLLHKFKFYKNYQLVMLDINMPIKNGIDTLKEIREIDPNVFIVMVSADSSTENIKATLALGVNGFVVKPYTSPKISGIIQKFNQHLLSIGLTPATPPKV